MQLEFALEDSPPAHRLRARAALRRIALQSGTLWYGLLRAQRRTLTIVVESGAVEVRAPRWTPLAEIEGFIRDKEPWISRRVEEARRKPRPFAWLAGERLPVLGESLRIVVTPGGPPGEVRRVDDHLEVGLPGDTGGPALRDAVLEWLCREAKHLFKQRITLYAPRLGVPEPELRLSNARTQWGSCSARGRVLLNWRLIHVPVRLIDYVVAHELAHLRELNHSRRFWALVENAYPGCGAARRELNRMEKQLPNIG
jgi:predicted metal-dependent hydrolase